MDDAVNALISPEPLRREFLGHERLVATLYGAVKPDPAALEFAGRAACLAAIADAIRAQLEKLIRLNRLRQLPVLNWRQKAAARSQLKLAIEDVLDNGLPRAYNKPLYGSKCSALFEHVYENYPDVDRNTYAKAG